MTDNRVLKLPSGVVGTYEQLKDCFYANKLTERDDLEELSTLARENFDDHLHGVIGAMMYYDVSVENILYGEQEFLENTFARVRFGYTREAAVIKGDDEAVKMIDRQLEQADRNMVERCRHISARLRCHF